MMHKKQDKKSIKSIQTGHYIILTGLLLMVTHKASGMMEGRTTTSEVQSSSAPAVKAGAAKPGVLNDAQKAQQAALPFGKRIASKTGETLGFQSRGMLIGKDAPSKFSTTQQSFATAEGITLEARGETMQNNSGITMDSGKIIGKKDTDRSLLQDRISNSFNNAFSGNKKITTRTESGQIRVDTIKGKDKEVVSTRVYDNSSRASYTDFNAQGKITLQVKPDGTRIINTYDATTGSLQTQREVTPNSLNFGNNKTSIVRSFNKTGNITNETITTGSGLTGTTILTKSFNNPENKFEYEVKDYKGKLVETRTYNSSDKSYETKDANEFTTQKTRLSQDKQKVESIEFFTDPKNPKARTTITADGSTQVYDSNGALKSEVKINTDGTITVISLTPEPWTLSGGLMNTGKMITTTSKIEGDKLTERTIEIKKANRNSTVASDQNSVNNSTVPQTQPSPSSTL